MIQGRIIGLYWENIQRKTRNIRKKIRRNVRQDQIPKRNLRIKQTVRNKQIHVRKK